jgi:hypothetical protein
VISATSKTKTEIAALLGISRQHLYSTFTTSLRKASLFRRPLPSGSANFAAIDLSLGFDGCGMTSDSIIVVTAMQPQGKSHETNPMGAV